MAGGNGTGVTPALVLRLTGGSLRVSRVSLGCCRPRPGKAERAVPQRTAALRELKRVGPKPIFARRMHCMCAAAAGSAHNARIARPRGTFSFECAERSNRGERVRVLFAWMCLAVRYGGPATVVCELSVRCRCALACGAALGVRTCRNYARVPRTPAIICTVMSPPLSLCACESHVSNIYASGHARECVSGGGL